MEILFYIGATLIVAVLVVKVVNMKRRHKAASNVVFAKFTFNKLNIDKQNSIHDKAIEMVHASDTNLRGFANEVERFGWYALAMDSLGIHSSVPDNPCWNRVKNPYLAILPGDSMIYNVTGALQQQYNIDVKISADKGYSKKDGAKKGKKKNIKAKKR